MSGRTTDECEAAGAPPLASARAAGDKPVVAVEINIPDVAGVDADQRVTALHDIERSNAGSPSVRRDAVAIAELSSEVRTRQCPVPTMITRDRPSQRDIQTPPGHVRAYATAAPTPQPVISEIVAPAGPQGENASAIPEPQSRVEGEAPDQCDRPISELVMGLSAWHPDTIECDPPTIEGSKDDLADVWETSGTDAKDVADPSPREPEVAVERVQERPVPIPDTRILEPSPSKIEDRRWMAMVVASLFSLMIGVAVGAFRATSEPPSPLGRAPTAPAAAAASPAESAGGESSPRTEGPRAPADKEVADPQSTVVVLECEPGSIAIRGRGAKTLGRELVESKDLHVVALDRRGCRIVRDARNQIERAREGTSLASSAGMRPRARSKERIRRGKGRQWEATKSRLLFDPDEL
jgi:hypothetical protein